MKYRFQVISIAVVFLALAVFAWVKPTDSISDSELRPLAQFPEISAKGLLDGSFMSEFETYTLDQFPLRDSFRTVKAVTSIYAFGQKDNNGIYIEDGYAVKMEYPLDKESISYAVGRFDNVYNKFIKDSDAKCYVTVVPDKNYYLAGEHGALAMDYETLFSGIENGMNYAQYIDISDLLSKEDFYHTDTHWNQAQITDVADRIAGAMGAELDSEYSVNTVEKPFYGVYYGQAALSMQPDEIQYVTNSEIDNAEAFDWQNNVAISVYDESKMDTRSPYDFFLGGSLSLITIDNPEAKNDRELVVFRDSFGSSITPLLISGYSKITLVDIRYLQGDRIGRFIEFDNQDVLFLYSTLVLNNSSTIK